MKIFMIGTQRSGSNLFRLMLNQLSEIAAPHPPHILKRMMPLVSSYGDLNQPLLFSLLVNDVCRLVELNPVPWEGVKLNRKDIMARCSQPNLYAVTGAVYDILAEAWGKRSWCNKSLANVRYAEELAQCFGDAKFIYLYRDGRDVALSFTKAIEGEKHYYHIAKDWNTAQKRALQLRDRIEPERFLPVSYENLVGNPEQTCKTVCEFLGVTYSDSMMDFHKSVEAQKAASSSELWSNVVRPLMQTNTRKFLKETKEEDLRIFESVAGEALDALGYERVLVKPGEELHFSEQEIAQFTLENIELKEAAWAALSEDDRERRNRQMSYIEEIVQRNSVLQDISRTPILAS
ncbi:MAG: sulfotransferase [Coleofasciculus sp. S288]|nr:sulfotransferase [Coleofasciculus sp. S288]